MIHDTGSRSSAALGTGGVMLSAADLSEAIRELEALRSTHRANPDVSVTELRIAHLERLIATATVIEVGAASDGAAGLGSFVRVRDDAGKEADYELVGLRPADAPKTQVTPGSPVGEALFGARTGDRVHVELPSGRRRPLTVVAIRNTPFREAAGSTT